MSSRRLIPAAVVLVRSTAAAATRHLPPEPRVFPSSNLTADQFKERSNYKEARGHGGGSRSGSEAHNMHRALCDDRADSPLQLFC